MLKRKSLRKLNRDTDARKRLFRQLIKSMAAKGQLVTSLAKAKAVRPQIEKLVTRAKNNSLANLRRLIAATGDMTTAQNLLKAGEVFKNRPGGYTRLIRLARRAGDASEQVRLEWVEPVMIGKPIKREIAPATKNSGPLHPSDSEAAKAKEKAAQKTKKIEKKEKIKGKNTKVKSSTTRRKAKSGKS